MTRLRTAAATAAVLGVLCVAPAPAARAQSRPLVAAEVAPVYQRLLARISLIKIFDHHAHPGRAGDAEVDPAPALPGSVPFRLRADNPDWAAATRAMFSPVSKAQLEKLNPGPKYFSAILDRLGIETSVANRITMSPDLDPARFKWVFYIDPVLFPFDNAGLAARNPDQALFMPNQTKLRQRFQREAGLSDLPASLDDYLAFVTHVLDDHKRRGAIAAKFEIAYLRSFVFDDPQRDVVESIYTAYRRGGTPGTSEYKAFQDFMFRYILAECGRLHLAVHIHSSAGTGDYFSVSGGNVMNLENVLRDPRYVQTTFVLIHGGYPFEHQAVTLASMPNVWLDSSATGSFVMFPDQFKHVLRDWLETYPDKITFGTDAFPVDEKMGVEEMYWMGVHNGRTALAAALAEMIVAREISEPQAMAMAHGYLHDNATNLYK